MLQVCSITAFALVQAFVLFIDVGQANANNNSSCAYEWHQVTNSSNSSYYWVLCSSTVDTPPSRISDTFILSFPSSSTVTPPSPLPSSSTVAPPPPLTSSSTVTSPPPPPPSSSTVAPPPPPPSSSTVTQPPPPPPPSSSTVAPPPPPPPTSLSTVTQQPPPPPPSSSTVMQPPPLPSSSSSVVPQSPGSVVIICLLVKVPYCNASLHGNTSSSQSQALLANITTNMKSTFSAVQVTVISAYLTSSSCGSNNYVALYIKVTFKLGIPTDRFIETILKDEIKDKYLGNLPVSDTQYNVTFEGVTLGYNIKDGECQKKCCVAGGPVVMVETCTPKDNKYKCEGFLAKTREELKHCHGETNDLCSSTPCTTNATPDKACTSHSPSLALLLLLTIASFLKLTAC